MCVAHKVTITEELAEKMTLGKGDEDSENELRNKLLERIADCCAAQVRTVPSGEGIVNRNTLCDVP